MYSICRASLRNGLVVLAAVFAWVPLPPAAVESLYSSGAYVPIQTTLTAFSNRTPVALLDGLIVVVTAAWIVLAIRDVAAAASGRLRTTLRIAWRATVWGAALYLVFLGTWGLNYRRVRLVEKLPFDPAAVTAEAARAAGAVAVARLNALHDRAHADGWPAPGVVEPSLADAFARASGEAGLPPSIVVARPKRTMLDWYFRRAGVDGMTDPFFLETFVASRVLPFERPFIVAHEWSHLAGIADEGEANFLGWLTCLRGSTASQYSGWLFLYGELVGAAPSGERAALAAAVADGPRADLQAIRERFLREVDPRIATAGWRVYDSYLKANRVEAGAASYAEVVRLVLGVRLADGPLITP